MAISAKDLLSATKGKKAKKEPLPRKPEQIAAAATNPLDPVLAELDSKMPKLPDSLRIENRKPLTPDQQAKVDAAMAKTNAAKQVKEDLRAKQKEIATEKARVRIEKLNAKQTGKAGAMPLTGKEAQRAIVAAAVEAHVANGGKIDRVPMRGAPKPMPAAAKAASKANGKAPGKATGAGKAAKGKAGKATAQKHTTDRAKGGAKGSKLALIVDLLKRKQGCTREDVLKATGWPSVSMQQQAKSAGLKLRKDKQKGQPTCYRAG